MTRRAIILTAAVAALPMAAPAAAPSFVGVLPPPTVKEAFADSYGQVILREFGAILRESADPNCLRSKGLTPDALHAFGETFMLRRGQAWLDMLLDFIDGPAADREFMKLGGDRAIEELRTLAADPVVREFKEIARPAQLDNLVDRVTEEFDRYSVLKQIKLVRQLSPISTGSDLMAESRAEPSEDAAEAFAEANQTPALLRFRELVEAMTEAMATAADKERMLRHGPGQSFPGADEELREHCIR